MTAVRSFLFALVFTFITAPALAAKTLVLPETIPFGKDVEVSEAVKAECQLPQKISQFIEEYAKPSFDSIQTGKSTKGSMVLDVEIYDVEGRGGGAWSGHKSLGIRGSLKQDGKVIGTFKAKRYSGGGAFGGYKGTCSILGRCTKALGKDVGMWLANPTMDARLGDL